MNLETYRQYCLDKKGVTEDFPFDQNVLVFRVGDKIFSLCDVNEFQSVNLKCDPERAIDLREKFNGIQPGYHMNKKHWNTIESSGVVPDRLIIELADHSYDLVLASLPAKIRKELGG
ncbi:MAG: MmcQ/YjbR family DNA-binding protein [Flavobacteriales bacterium]|nr:MmcQ/YjbR family DNA-binding protein [Flavobacteriales bacterium]